jgi:hypothetical protein
MAILPLGMAALAGELAGITMPDTLKAGEKTLKLLEPLGGGEAQTSAVVCLPYSRIRPTSFPFSAA